MDSSHSLTIVLFPPFFAVPTVAPLAKVDKCRVSHIIVQCNERSNGSVGNTAFLFTLLLHLIACHCVHYYRACLRLAHHPSTLRLFASLPLEIRSSHHY